MREVVVVTDGTADVTPELAKELGIAVVPVMYAVDDEQNWIGLGLDRTAFIDKLLRSKKLNTSGINVQEFYDAMEGLLKEAKSLVVICLAPQISVTYNSGLSAAELLEDAKIKVFNSDGAFVGVTALVCAAARMAQAGASYEEICSFVEHNIPRTVGYVISTNMAYLGRVGRITEGRDEEGREMKLAIVRIMDGKIMPFDAAGDWDEAIEKVVGYVGAAVRADQPLSGVFCQVRNADGLERLRKRISESFACRDVATIDECPTGAVIGSINAVGFGYCPLD